jgi:hypothetical protein
MEEYFIELKRVSYTENNISRTEKKGVNNVYKIIMVKHLKKAIIYDFSMRGIHIVVDALDYELDNGNLDKNNELKSHTKIDLNNFDWNSINKEQTSLLWGFLKKVKL